MISFRPRRRPNEGELAVSKLQSSVRKRAATVRGAGGVNVDEQEPALMAPTRTITGKSKQVGESQFSLQRTLLRSFRI
jgi:hypothetical protein